MLSKRNKKCLVMACPDNYFLVNLGPTLKDLKDLKDALAKMSEETFRYHVNQEKNDFAKWVEEVLNDAELALDLRKADTLTMALQTVEQHLKKYK